MQRQTVANGNASRILTVRTLASRMVAPDLFLWTDVTGRALVYALSGVSDILSIVTSAGLVNSSQREDTSAVLLTMDQVTFVNLSNTPMFLRLLLCLPNLDVWRRYAHLSPHPRLAQIPFRYHDAYDTFDERLAYAMKPSINHLSGLNLYPVVCNSC